jgi:hypothetical protein
VWAVALSTVSGKAKVPEKQLKECEFRFNHRGEDIASVLLGILKKNPPF